MLTFAIGRGLERYDRPVVNTIAHKLADNQYKFSTLIMGIVNSAAFQMAKAEQPVMTNDVAESQAAGRPASPAKEK